MKHSRSRRLLGFALSLVLLAPWLLAQTPESVAEEPVFFDIISTELEISPELLESTTAEVTAAVRKEMGATLKDVPVRLATVREIEEVLNAELVQQFRVQFGDGEVAETQRALFASLYSKALLGKFAVEAREVLICEENFNNLARLLERPGLATPEVLRTVLCHEMVHAADFHTYHWNEVLDSRDTAEAIQAYSAVLEGHAQLVTRKICAKQGWGDAFELFTEAIGLSPATGDAAVDYFLRILAVTSAFAYHDGERFMTALDREGGAKTMARAFADPPLETVLILEPSWYLDPSTRPAMEFDLERTLDAFGEGWDDEDWTKQQIPVLRPQLEASLALLPKEKVGPVLDHSRQCRVMILTGKHDPPGTRLVMVGLFEFDATSAATEFLVLEEDLLRLKDEQLTKGMVRIEDAHYEPVAKGPVRGMFSSKRVIAGATELDARVLVASRGRLMVELNYIGEEADRDGLLAVATRILEARAAQEKKGAEEKADEDSEEEGDGGGESGGR